MQISQHVRSELTPLLVVLSFFLCSSLLVSPLRNVPVIDDWTYAWSVEHLLATGRLAILDNSAHYNLFETYWGALWGAVFGFSFGVLRFSTVTLAAAGCGAFYLLLRELGLDRQRSLLGALTLAANPVFFVLAFSFMTDVPFLSLTLLALLCYAAGLTRDQPAWLWAGSIFAVCAFLSRQIGIVTPLAVAPCLTWRRDGRPGLWQRLLPIVLALTAVCLFQLWMMHSLGRTSDMELRLHKLRYLHLVSARNYLGESFFMLLQVAFYLFPLLLAGFSLQSSKRLLIGVALLPVLAAFLWWFFGEIPSPIPLGGTWSLRELAIVRGLIQGSPPERAPADVFDWPVRAVMVISGAALISGFFKFKIREVTRAELMLISYALLQLGLINLLWLHYDRYALVLLPPFIYLALKMSLWSAIQRGVAWGGLALLGFVSVTGTWDALRFNEACLDAFDRLRARGIPAAEIDAGYSLTGWTLYAHPENMPPGVDPREDAPWVTSNRELPYVIANSPLPGRRVIEEVSWVGVPWAASNRLYVLISATGNRVTQ
jgi:hypothetical protein